MCISDSDEATVGEKIKEKYPDTSHTQPHKTLANINCNKDQWKKQLKSRALVQIKKNTKI
jgi:hypothetical protein